MTSGAEEEETQSLDPDQRGGEAEMSPSNPVRKLIQGLQGAAGNTSV